MQRQRESKTPQKLSPAALPRQRRGESRGHYALWPSETVLLRSTLQKNGYCNRTAFSPPARNLGRSHSQISILGSSPKHGRRKRVTVRHRRSDADNGCPPKAADGSQEHIRNTEAMTANAGTEYQSFRFGCYFGRITMCESFCGYGTPWCRVRFTGEHGEAERKACRDAHIFRFDPSAVTDLLLPLFLLEKVKGAQIFPAVILVPL